MSCTNPNPIVSSSDVLGLGETFGVESHAACGGGCGGGCGEGCGGGCAGAHADVDRQPHTDTQADPVLRMHIDDSLFAAWTSNQFSASSDWLPAAPVKRVRARWELRDLVGPFRAAPGFQVANRETAPGAFNNIGTQQTTEGVRQTEWEDLASYVDDKVLIRFGWVTRNSTGTALSFGHARGVFEVELFCGSVLQFELPFGERFPPGEIVVPQGVEWPSVAEVAAESAGPLGGLRAAMMPGLAVVGPMSLDVSTSASTTLDTSLFDCFFSEQRMPDFSSVHLHTQLCFAVEYLAAEWPTTDCAPRPCDVRGSCEPPKEGAILDTMIRLRNFGNKYAEDVTSASPAEATDDDKRLLNASFRLLVDNMDLALWAACLVKSWSPEMAGLRLDEGVQYFLTPGEDGYYPLSVSYVNTQEATGATMWAYTVLDKLQDLTKNPYLYDSTKPYGLIVSVDKDRWNSWVEEFLSPSHSFCALVQVASTILHEIIHILGDGHDNGIVPKASEKDPENVSGALHECYREDKGCTNYHCWDEARMVATIFVWGMSQRFKCVTDVRICSNMDNNLYFALSPGTEDQIRNE